MSNFSPLQHTVPPLRLAWKVAVGLESAVVAENTVYGITPGGALLALDSRSGTQRWQASGTYVPGFLHREGTRLFAYISGEGLVFVDDTGSSATVRLMASFNASPAANLSVPVSGGRMVFVAVNQGLYALHQDDGLQFAHILSDVVPHSTAMTTSGDLIVMDGKGRPSRYRVQGEGLQLVWNGTDHAIAGGQLRHPFIITSGHLVVGVGQDTVCYNLAAGTIAWHLPNVPAKAFAVSNNVLYAAFLGASLWAIDLATGALLWQRQFVCDLSLQQKYSLVVAEDHVWFGGTLQTNPDGANLIAVHKNSGQFAWLSRTATGAWGGGQPLWNGRELVCHGAEHTAAYVALQSPPAVSSSAIEVVPAQLRGTTPTFGSVKLRIQLQSAARVTAVAYRERQGTGVRILNDVQWQAGSHEVTWSASGQGGFSDAAQFGHILVTVTEPAGNHYTQTVLLPVNTFPDIRWHWAREFVETMVFHKFVNGYLDQTFKPDNLMNRAESSTIIAKTLGLEAAPPGFRTRFTDIQGHWAAPHIMALEERGVIGGFAEPDGSFTFRPNLNMTRAQQARILVRAYAIPLAPDTFASRFTDTRGHWAESDIRALEAAGYVTGFRESDGSFTYRPEQNLTRAEMCTIIVRIKGLSR